MNESELHRSILEIVEAEKQSNPVSYNKEQPYQSYERIGFEGLRWSVEKRIAEYRLERLYAPDVTFLDIGSNFGFFVSEFALHGKYAHGVEPNRALNRIGRLVASYLGLDEKTKFFDMPFEEFPENIQYDRVTSLAAFYTSDGHERTDAATYFGKIERLLAPGGLFFYESTSFPTDPSSPDYGHYIASREAIAVIEGLFNVQESYQAKSGRYDRHFMLTAKRS